MHYHLKLSYIFPPDSKYIRKKLMYDALHIGILEKFEDDEKHLSENVDGIVKDDKTKRQS